ncbi:DUF1254 domain-containing protein [Psychromonas aquimarina]|uniref:DUF1254 domain-containing protein n=1 Tax=Psychromonas aquimarina TaxID=444919 RepID=UPI000420B7E5|nr:DUF1214 domain-containing protein [Psychromonas aquimarina]
MNTIKKSVIAIAIAAATISAPVFAETIPNSSMSSTEYVVGGPTGSVMTPEYAETVAAFAYTWGWPMVNMQNRQTVFSQVPYQSLLGGAMPAAPINLLTMLTDYISPDMRDVAHPNQDVVYGFSMLDLSKEPVIVQVPDFGERFWNIMVEDQRTDSFAKLGSQHATKPGFYMLVGPSWDGDLPKGVNGVFRSSTDLGVVIPRAFMDDTKQDRIDIQEPVNQLAVYPLSQFDGKMKVTDWASLPDLSDPNADTSAGEKSWVNPETFFTKEQLGTVLKTVAPLPGEQAVYQQFEALLEQVEKDPKIKKAVIAAAKQAEKELIPSLFRLENVGKEVNNYWTTPMSNGRFGTDYLTRLGVAKSNIFTNDRIETNYFYQYKDSIGERINGNNKYTLTFEKGQTPPVISNGFWSLTMYDENHFFSDNELKRYSIGTKNKELKYNDDGSLTLYIQHQRPSEDKVSNWLPAPDGKVAMTIRAYGPTEDMLSGDWQPPAIVKVK